MALETELGELGVGGDGRLGLGSELGSGRLPLVVGCEKERGGGKGGVGKVSVGERTETKGQKRKEGQGWVLKKLRTERLDLSLLLKGVNDILVSPSDLVGQSLEGAVLSSGLESENSEGLGDDHLLLPVVGRGHALVQLESLERSLSSGRLVGSLQQRQEKNRKRS